MEFVPYKLLNGTECAVLAAKASSAVGAWNAAWAGHAGDPAEVSISPAVRFAESSSAEPEWLAYDAGEGLVYVAGRESSRAWASRLLSGGAATGALANGTLAAAAVDKALEDLAARIAGSPVLPAAAMPPPETWLRYSGAAWIHLAEGAPEVIADPRITRRMLAGVPRPPRRGPPVTNPQLGLGKLPVGIDVWLGTADLELSVFQTLAPGDVIQLDSRIDQPLKVTVDGRNAAPRAFLGFSGDRRAVRLTGQAGAPPRLPI